MNNRIVAVVLAVIMTIALVGFASGASATPPDDKKVYVCKYVGKPGVDERLQTGQNPIEVSVNAIPQDPVVVGSYFADAQGRSYVLGFVPMSPEPTAANCPAPDVPEEPTEVTPVGATLNPPTCDVSGSLVVPAQPEGVVVTPAPGTYGPGVWHVDFKPVSDDYVLVDDNETMPYVVKDKLSGPECEEVVEPTEFSVTADAVDQCGVVNDRVFHSDGAVTWTKPVNTNKRVVLVASDIRGDDKVLTGQSRWVFDFDTTACDRPEEPQEPSEPRNNEPAPVPTVNSPAVPTAVDAGLSTVSADAVRVTDRTLGIVAIVCGLLGIVLGLISMSRRR